MPRFHFNIRHGGTMEDSDGTDLPDLRAARLEGIRLAGAVLADEADRFDDGQDWTLQVTNEIGLTLFLMTFLITRASAVPSPRINGFDL